MNQGTYKNVIQAVHTEEKGLKLWHKRSKYYVMQWWVYSKTGAISQNEVSQKNMSLHSVQWDPVKVLRLQQMFTFVSSFKYTLDRRDL